MLWTDDLFELNLASYHLGWDPTEPGDPKQDEHNLTLKTHYTSTFWIVPKFDLHASTSVCTSSVKMKIILHLFVLLWIVKLHVL